MPPDQIAAVAAFGHDLWQQGSFEDAERIFLGLIALDDSIYYGHAGMGLVALTRGDLPEAERHLEKAVTLEASDPAILVNLGEARVRQGRIEPALSILQRAADCDPSGNNAGARRARAILAALAEAAAASHE
jgi:tetratricopeptide (TPR) repeat protein